MGRGPGSPVAVRHTRARFASPQTHCYGAESQAFDAAAA